MKNEIINKYNISEQDLYTLGVIEAKKSMAGFFEKEKLKAKSMGVLKPYNVKFMDLGNLLSEIEKQSYHNNQDLIDKYGELDLDNKASSAGLKYILPILVGVVVFFYIFNISSSNTSSSTSTSSNTSTSTSINNDASLEESKRVYRQGYSDGQTGYGLPASSRASADEFYMARGYNFSSADYNVYKMGYNDGVYGKRKRY
tara:strand:+ start:2651 stop:3250 length:600 start_codon:yes stop_codon:yes gene_type:complete